jgi:hypothetical protein
MKDDNEIDDPGHIALFEDVSELLADVKSGEFHDYLNVKYDMPKTELVRRLNIIRDNIINGLYDNRKRREKHGACRAI